MVCYRKYSLAGAALVCAMTAHASDVYCDGATQHITHYYAVASHQPKAKSAIFRAQLLDVYIDSSLVVYRSMGIEHPVFYRFQVLESWAPSYGPQHYITALTYADKQLPLRPGTEYLVATMGTTQGAFLWLDRCDLLKPVAIARPDLQLLGPGTVLSAPKHSLHKNKERVPASTVPSLRFAFDKWMIGIVLLALLNTLLLVRLGWRR